MYKNWLDNNSLEINMDKIKYIRFGIKKPVLLLNHNIIVHSYNYVTNNNLNNKCNCIILNRGTSLKYLGIYIDENLKWDILINYINNTLKKFFCIFKPLEHILNFKLKKQTYRYGTDSDSYFLWDFFLGRNIQYSPQ